MNAPCICPACKQEVANLPMNFDALSGLLVAGSGVAQFTAREADYFSCFAAKWPEPVTRWFLYDWVYGAEPGDGVQERIIDVFVMKLRRKIRPLGLDIENIWAKGYRLVYLT